MTDLVAERDWMVEMQLAARGIADEAVLEAMRRVPREDFVPEDLAEFAYDDAPLPIGEGQTISQPYVVALMLEAAALKPGDRVLEIGTGSGYAAAVASRIAAEIHSVERHGALAREARSRLRALGYDNVQVHEGDGTLGDPEHGPFDAILVTAGGPTVPDALKRQLALGGRLVIPVGGDSRRQTLLQVVRRDADDFAEEELGAVAFVPLVGEQGWSDPEASPSPAGARNGERPAGDDAIARRIAAAAIPLPRNDRHGFTRLFDDLADAQVVLLGEATHGTSEFYTARAWITQRLIREHGFTIVAVEADWPDAARIDRYVRHREPSQARDPAFARFPTWMWRNVEVRDFVEWLREHNAGLPQGRRAGFYGLDLYSLASSIDAVLDYLDRVDPEAARAARERYGCLTPWQSDPATYGRAAMTPGFRTCEKEVLATLDEILKRRFDYMRRDGERFLDAAQNARLVAAAEEYYRAMYYGSRESWNLRDRHMFETLESLLAARGAAARAVVWAHNSHIGNAAATEMGAARGELNLGQLCRERFGEEAFLLGFGTDRGTVAAADDWGGPVEIKTVRPAHRDSYEYLCRSSGVPAFRLDLAVGRGDGGLVRALMRPRLERAIGVIYRPETELWSHYFEAALPRQFDAYVWFEETRAVTPLPTEPPTGAPDTYPFGV